MLPKKNALEIAQRIRYVIDKSVQADEPFDMCIERVTPLWREAGEAGSFTFRRVEQLLQEGFAPLPQAQEGVEEKS